MKRHVAATVLGVLGFFIVDSHVHWVQHDNGALLEVTGRSFDVKGWLSEHWRQAGQDCRAVQTVPNEDPMAQAVLAVIAQHSPPHSLQAELVQLRVQGDWAMADVQFKLLNPSIVLLRQLEGAWHIQDRALWSGSAAPWLPADFVRRYLQDRAPQAPQALLNCMPIDARRFALANVGALP